MNDASKNTLDVFTKHILTGKIMATKMPEIEINKETNTLTFTMYKNTYILIGFKTYKIEEDFSTFIPFENNCLIKIGYNTNNGLISGIIHEHDIPGDDTIYIGSIIFKDGEIESTSFFDHDKCVSDILSLTTSSPIIISNVNNCIMFPAEVFIMYKGINKTIKIHHTIDMKNNTDIILYYNPYLNKFSINNENTIGLIPVASYNKITNNIGLNNYPDAIKVEDNTLPKYEVIKAPINFNKNKKCIEWNSFHVVNSYTGEISTISEGFINIDKYGFYFVILNPNTRRLEVVLNATSIPNNFTIINTFTYSKDGFVLDYDKINEMLPLEERLEKLEDCFEEKILIEDGSLVLTNEIYRVNNNPILTSCLTISGNTSNTLTIIDSDNKIHYQGITLDIATGENIIFSDMYTKAVNVYDYTLKEVQKDYKMGIISNIRLYDEDLPLPGEVLFNKVSDDSFERLVGIDTSRGHSPFMRIAGSLDKEKYPSWCFRNTGSKNEISYALSNDKSGDFYIFDLRYYLISMRLNDNNPLTHIIIQASHNSDETSLEAIKILYTLIHDAYPNINIGIIPMVFHGLRNNNKIIELNKKNCVFTNKVINTINNINDKYNISVIPMWLYINPSVINTKAIVYEAWNCIAGWACKTF